MLLQNGLEIEIDVRGKDEVESYFFFGGDQACWCRFVRIDGKWSVQTSSFGDLEKDGLAYYGLSNLLSVVTEQIASEVNPSFKDA